MRTECLQINKKSSKWKSKKPLDLGLIRNSTSCYASPCLLLNKPDGGFRPVIDYSKLNKQTLCQASPIGRIDDLIDKLCKAKYLIKLDITKAHWNVLLDEESIKYTGFVTPTAHYEFLVFPLGLSGACNTFNRIIGKVLQGLNACTAGYFDDVLVHNKSWSEDIIDIERVLTAIQNAGMTLNKNKCQFGNATVDFLGFEVGLGKLEPNKRKVEAIINFPKPTCKKQIQQWCDLASYFQRYIPHFQDIVAELTNMLKSNQNLSEQIK